MQQSKGEEEEKEEKTASAKGQIDARSKSKMAAPIGAVDLLKR
jgi:hypothetical protein